MDRMRIVPAIGLAVFALPAAILRAAGDDESYGPPPPSDRPVAFCDHPVFDFGAVFEGEAVRHDFVIENRGKAPLLIERVRPSCRCAAAEFQDRIPPGGEGKVTVVLDTKGLFSGPITKSAFVYTNDPLRRQLELRLQGEIKQVLRFEPRRPVLSEMAGTGTRTIDVRAFAASECQVEIVEVKVSSPAVACTVETVEPGKSFIFHISLDTSDGRTYRYEIITIRAKAGGREVTLSLPLTTRLRNPIAFEYDRPYVNFLPRDVRAWLQGQGQALKKSTCIESADGKPFEVTGLDVKDPWIKATYEKVGDGSSWRISVELVSKPKKLAATVGRTLVTVRTNHPSVPTVDLHVMATF